MLFFINVTIYYDSFILIDCDLIGTNRDCSDVTLIVNGLFSLNTECIIVYVITKRPPVHTIAGNRSTQTANVKLETEIRLPLTETYSN